MSDPIADAVPAFDYRSASDGEADAAILDAALAELAASGYAGATIAAIAERANVDKQSIYQRWRSKQQLVLEAITSLARQHRMPHTGSLRGDLLEILSALGSVLTHPGTAPLLGSLAVAAQQQKSAAIVLHTDFLTDSRASVLDALRRGQRLGEIRRDQDVSALADALLGPLYLRVLLVEGPVNDAFIVQIVDAVLRGATVAGSASGKRTDLSGSR